MRSAIAVLMGIVLMGACSPSQTPRPRAYPRVEYFPKNYQSIQPDACPYSFEIPQYAVLESDSSSDAEPCWYNLHFRPYNSRLHLTYKSVRDPAQLRAYVHDAFEFVYKHTVKALRIDEKTIHRPEDSVFGMYFYLEGNTATAIQFFVTDSTRSYLRGALYFQTHIQRDSLQPIIDFLNEDVLHLIETVRWTSPGKK